MNNAERYEEAEKEASDKTRLRVDVIYEVIKQEGDDEISRSFSSLWWSGIAAGLVLFLSIFAKGALYASLGSENLLVHVGYCFGFVMVILGRLQLFTENTITAVLPLLNNWKRSMLYATLRLWLIVFAANLVGMLAASLFSYYGNVFPADIMQGMMDISHHYVERDAMDFLVQGVPAGFILAGIVWMLPSSRGGSEFWVIMSLTYLISLGDFAHVIAGSGEIFLVMLDGHLSLYDGVVNAIFPSLLGNVIGGTLLFTLLAYGQVWDELKSAKEEKHPKMMY